MGKTQATTTTKTTFNHKRTLKVKEDGAAEQRHPPQRAARGNSRGRGRGFVVITPPPLLRGEAVMVVVRVTVGEGVWEEEEPPAEGDAVGEGVEEVVGVALEAGLEVGHSG